MSIESEITRIVHDVDTQTELIEQIKAALEGKAVGGGSGATTALVRYSYNGVQQWEREYEVGVIQYIKLHDEPTHHMTSSIRDTATNEECPCWLKADKFYISSTPNLVSGSSYDEVVIIVPKGGLTIDLYED